MNINNDFADMVLEEQELVTEWTVDPKKKSKLIDTALHKFQSECKKSKNIYIKNRVYIFNESQLRSANKNFLFKGGVRENKLRNIFVGCYDFHKRPKDVEDPYPELKQIVSRINSEMDGVKIKITIRDDYVLVVGDPITTLISGIINLIRAGVTKNKVGTLYIGLEKSAIKESSLCDDGADFTNEIMDDLF